MFLRLTAVIKNKNELGFPIPRRKVPDEGVVGGVIDNETWYSYKHGHYGCYLSYFCKMMSGDLNIKNSAWSIRDINDCTHWSLSPGRQLRC